MGYQPFLIAPFGTGLETDVEPWLAPQDAFTDVENAHIHHGYIEKRKGYQFLAQIVHGRDITAATTANPAVFTVSSATGLSDGDSVTLAYLAGGTWDSLNLSTYTIDNLSGATFNLVDSSGTTVDGSGLGTYTASTGRLGTFEGLRVMGIMRYLSADNTRIMLASDTERVALYNSSANIFTPMDLLDSGSTLRPNSDVWSSADTDYIWAANWQASGLVNRVYLTNGKAYQSGTPGTDGIVYYDASTTIPQVVQFQPSLGGSNVLYGAKMIFSIKQRLVALHTFEYNGSTTNTFPQRARWCAIQGPSNWDDTVAGGGDFLDAATGEQIISATQIQDMIVVHFTESVWLLRPVSNPKIAFRWERINSQRACDGRMATVGYDRYSLGVGIRGITATDGVETRRVDQRIEDFTTESVDADEFDKVFGERSYNNRRTWILYPSRGSNEADSALILDEETGAYSKYRINMNVLGYGTTIKDFTAADFVAANDLDVAAEDLNDETAGSWFYNKNADLFLGGDRSGNVHILETGNTDNGTDIPVTLTGAAWNPYKEQTTAQFGYLDLYGDADQVTRLTIDFFKDTSPTPYASQAMDLLPTLNYRSSIANIEINADPTTGFIVTANTHGLVEDDEVYFYGILGGTWLNDMQWVVGATVTEDTFSVDSDITGLGFAITGATQANPCVVTATGHTFANGDVVTIVDITGMTELNGNNYIVANVTTNTFELQGIDSSAFTAYSSGGYAFLAYQSGGKIVERKFYKDKVWKRAYAGGYGHQHKVRITAEGENQPLKIHAFKPWFRPRTGRALG